MTKWGILLCPDCGGNLNLSPVSIACSRCGLIARLDGNVVRFDTSDPEIAGPRQDNHPPGLIALAASALHPLRGRLSPLRWYTDRRVEAYYARCVTEKRLADEFRDHYVPNALWAVSGRALDFGCGRGRIVALLGQLDFEVVGMDITSHASWRTFPAAFVVSRGRRLPFRDGTFDLVTHFGVLMYLRDPQCHLGEIHRVLRPGGYLSMQVTNRYCLRKVVAGRFGDAEFFQVYSQEELMWVLQRAGFEVERTSSEMFYAPLCPVFINFVRRVLLPRRFDLFDRDSLLVRLTPPRYRGVVNAVAKKA